MIFAITSKRTITEIRSTRSFNAIPATIIRVFFNLYISNLLCKMYCRYLFFIYVFVFPTIVNFLDSWEIHTYLLLLLGDPNPGEGGTWPTNIRGRAAGKSKELPCPGVKLPENDTLSRSKIFLNNTLSFSFFGQSCALQGNLYEIYRKLWKYCHSSDLSHIRRVKMA